MCEITRANSVTCYIIPPDILQNIVRKGSAKARDLAFHALEVSAQIRGQRQVLNAIAMLGGQPGVKRRTVYDAQNGTDLPGTQVRGEGDPESGDAAADEAYDNSGKTYDFYLKVFNRNSLDNQGMGLDSSVHYDSSYNNAFWNGEQMVYGDGDGVIFTGFTSAIEVVAHELTHGITSHEAKLVYQDQSGALNEHFSDVFGALVAQFYLQQDAASADWLIGKGILGPRIRGVALRSMKAPGTAYNDSVLGKDPQPAHMKSFVKTNRDFGGVHTNSGIPNKAFFNVAISLGGNAWDKPGHIWYKTLIGELAPNASFQDCADGTTRVARSLYDNGVAQQVAAAWSAVGVAPSAAATAAQVAVPAPPAAGAPAAAGAAGGAGAGKAGAGTAGAKRPPTKKAGAKKPGSKRPR
ncbi:MAG TPA: M4 family metallopeptidase [Thermoanaerobaculia bacterium]|nr:M4 family metallopeptidase [Thermoanaerobaculia bacterium]